MKNRLKYLAILFFAVVGMCSCNPDPEITQPPAGSSVSTFEQALSAIQGTWYLEYREDVLYSCSNGTGEVLSRRMSDLNYSDYEFQFTNTAATSMFGNALSQYNTSGAYMMYGAGGAYDCPFFFYKNGATGNTFNPYLGVSTNPDQLYFYSETQFQFDDNIYIAGGKITFIDSEHFSLEVSDPSNVSYRKKVLHFTKNNSNFSGTSEIQNIKGSYVQSYKEIYISNVLNQTVIQDPFPMNITDTLISPAGFFNTPSDFPGFREIWYIAHGMGVDWDGNGFDVTSYYPIGYDNSGNVLGRDGELLMLGDGIITLSPEVNLAKPEVLKIILNNTSELVLRSYQGCSDYIDYHFTKVN